MNFTVNGIGLFIHEANLDSRVFQFSYVIKNVKQKLLHYTLLEVIISGSQDFPALSTCSQGLLAV